MFQGTDLSWMLNVLIDEVAKRIVGPEGVPITITTRVRRMLAKELVDVDKPVTLIRQPVIPMPDRLCEGPVGLGIDLVRLDNGHFQVRKLQSGGAANITGKLHVGDVVNAINGVPLITMGPRADISGLVLGEAFSRVSVTVNEARGERVVHMVRSVVLLGEYLMKLKAYENVLDHAILIPTPPSRESADTHLHSLPQRPSVTRLAPSPPVGGEGRQLMGDASCEHFLGPGESASRPSILDTFLNYFQAQVY